MMETEGLESVMLDHYVDEWCFKVLPIRSDTTDFSGSPLSWTPTTKLRTYLNLSP